MFHVSHNWGDYSISKYRISQEMCPRSHIFLLDRFSFDTSFVQSLAPRLEFLSPLSISTSIIAHRKVRMLHQSLPASFNSLQLHEFPAIRLCRTGNIIPSAGIHTVSAPSYSIRSYKLTRYHEHRNTVQQEKRNITFIIQLHVATYMHSYVCMGNLHFDLSQNCSKLCNETEAVS